MGIIIASEAQLNRYLEQQQQLQDTSSSGIQNAVRRLEERQRALTEESAASRELTAIGNGAHLTDKSVGGIQRAIDRLEAADPHGLRTALPATVEQLARLKDTSFSGIQGATALLRIVEKQEPLTDKSVSGHNRAAQVAASAPMIAREIRPAPVATPPVEQSPAVEQQAPAQQKGFFGRIAEAFERAVATVKSWFE